MVLYSVVAIGNGVDRKGAINWLQSEALWSGASPQERDFIVSSHPTQQQIINATWRVEALHALVWALGLIDRMDPLTGNCDLARMQGVLPKLGESTSEFVKQATLRDEADILKASEDIYNAHWKVRDAQVNRRDVPDRINPSVIQERHYALNWLTGYGGLDWDDITTDT